MLKAELAITNGILVDGTGKPRFRANVAIDQGRIVSIGEFAHVGAERIVDAESFTVAPGWVDIHTHAEHTLLGNPSGDSFIRQGTTTAVFGNCGMSPAPVSDEFRRELGEQFEPPTTVSWGDYGEFLRLLQKKGLGLNVVPLVGHGALRIAVMGFDKREPSSKEMDEMKAILDDCMKEGVAGMSSGLGYAPGIYSKTDELVELCTVVARHGGIYASHTRGNRNDYASYTAAVKEAIHIGETAQLPVQVSHMCIPEAIRPIEEAGKRGLDVTFDMYPYTAAGGSISIAIPEWTRAGGGLKSLLDRIKERETRERIKREFEVGPRPSWSNLLIAYLESEKIRHYQGKTVQQVANMLGKHPVDAACDMLLETEGQTRSFRLDAFAEEEVRAAYVHPAMMVGSDGHPVATREPYTRGLVHPRNYGTYPRVLSKYVRDLELLSLENAIQRMTSLPAKKVGLNGRGILKPGHWADIVIFDPNTIQDMATFGSPHQYPIGIEYVLVNGQFVVEQGRETGILPGKVLLKSALAVM